MSISVKDVEHVANLARLALTEAEKEQFAGQLSAILKYAEKLNELNTDGIEPTSHVLPLYNVNARRRGKAFAPACEGNGQRAGRRGRTVQGAVRVGIGKSQLTIRFCLAKT